MNLKLRISLFALVANTVCFHGVALAAPENEEKAAQEAVMRAIKSPEAIKWGQFSLAGANGACLTVYTKNSLSKLVGSNEAFLIRKANGWDTLYIAEIPSGHKGCIEEMSRR